MYQSLRDGLPPNAGGLNDQEAYFIECKRHFEDELARIERDRNRRRKAPK